MTSPEEIALVGIDKDLIDLLRRSDHYRLVGVLDRDPTVGHAGMPWLGPDEDWPRIASERPSLVAALTIDPPQLRRHLAAVYESRLARIIAADAYVSADADVAGGCIVQSGCRVMADVRIGMACKLNIDVVVHHDCQVGAFSTLSPGARLLGRVELGEGCYVGAGAIVLPRMKIGAGATIGAGAVVVNDVNDGEVVMGVPARKR